MCNRIGRIQICLLGLFALALAACAHHATIVSADQHAVTVRYTSAEDAAEKANHYCRQFHERAQLSSTQADTGGYQQATYACVPR